MPLTRLKNEYLEKDGVRFLMADEIGDTVSCRVTHEACESTRSATGFPVLIVLFLRLIAS
jgi:hypothetical protein